MRSILRPRTTLLALAVGLASVGAAHAQAVDDRWEISGSYFRPDVQLSGKGTVTATDGVTTESASGQAGISDRFNGGQVEGIWRFSPRQRVVAGWYGVGRDWSQGLSESGTVTNPDTDLPIDYSVDANGRIDTDFKLYRLTYGYDVFQNDNTTVTALVGAYGASLDARVRTSGTALVDGEAYDLTGEARLDETRYAPGIGLSTEWRPADRWDVRASVQGFKTQWGNFDTRGHFYNAQVQAGYRFTPQWTGYVGYDWFDLELRDSDTFQGTDAGTTYTATADLTGRLKVHGPVVGIRASF